MAVAEPGAKHISLQSMQTGSMLFSWVYERLEPWVVIPQGVAFERCCRKAHDVLCSVDFSAAEMNNVFLTLGIFFLALCFSSFFGKVLLRDGRNAAHFLPKILLLLSEAMSLLIYSGKDGSSLQGQKRKVVMKLSK